MDKNTYILLENYMLSCMDLSNHEKIANKPIGEMNKKEIATMLTFISRGERFCDGYIAGFVESGDLLKLMIRLRELS